MTASMATDLPEPDSPTTASTGGIASPLVEKTKTEGTAQVPDRDYYADGLTSSDGLLILPAIKTLRMTDANGALPGSSKGLTFKAQWGI